MKKIVFAFCLLFYWTAQSSEIVSIYAVNTKTGRVVFSQNSDLSLIPSSCLKLVTTGAALHLLGPEYRFCTHLAYDGVIDQKVLKGNLYIKGGGDPCLGSGRVNGSLSWPEQIAQFTDCLTQKGITTIQGDILADTSYWEEEGVISSWTYEDVGNYYGAAASPLSFNENSYTLFFKPGAQEKSPTTISHTDPPLLKLKLKNEVLTGPAGSGDRACIFGLESSFFQLVKGTIPFGVKEFSIKGAHPKPHQLCTSLLTCACKEKGIKILKQKHAHTDRKTLLTLHSPPLKDIVHWTNQKSVNLYAEHLLKEMGKQIYQEGSTLAGIKAVLGFWKSQGIDLTGFHMEDGSGLSRKNFMTTQQLVSVLQVMQKSPHFSLFFQSLPDTHNIRGKTGFMSHNRGLAGYSGDIAFAILINNATDSSSLNQNIQEALLKIHDHTHN